MYEEKTASQAQGSSNLTLQSISRAPKEEKTYKMQGGHFPCHYKDNVKPKAL